MLETLVFDLDDTLLDTQNQITLPLLKKVHSFVESQGYNVSLQAILKFRYEHNTTVPHRDFFQRLGRRLTRDPDEAKAIADKMTQHYYSFRGPFGISIPKGLIGQLDEWAQEYALFLITAGQTERQSQKVAELRIGSFFKHVFIADKAKNISKADCLLQILEAQGGSAGNALSIGNRVDLEIRESKLLGMKTCLVLTGEYKDLKPTDRLEEPDFVIPNLYALPNVIDRIQRGTA